MEAVKLPHTSILGLVGELQHKKPDSFGEVSVFCIRIHQSSRVRLVTFLHHLALGLEHRGIVLKRSDKGLFAIIEQDSVRLEIIEERRRVKHDPTPSELKKKEEFERRWEIARRRGQWLEYEHFWPEFDYIYSGKLTFEIANWADGKTQSVESMLDQICDGVLFHLAYEKARREEREDQERRRQHLARRLELFKKRQEREGKRIAFLNALADYQREASDLRTTISAATDGLDEMSPEYLRMIIWAKQRLAFLEAQNDPTALTQHLVEQNLFPDVDELLDPEGDPPPRKNYWDD